MLQVFILVISFISAGNRSELGPGSFFLDFKDIMKFSIDHCVIFFFLNYNIVQNKLMKSECGQ